MGYDNGFIWQKTVDWSLLNDGMTFPVSVCSLFTSHHIDYFTHSQNNDSTNIIIISPNYHRIIHKNNPRFNRKNQKVDARRESQVPVRVRKWRGFEAEVV